MFAFIREEGGGGGEEIYISEKVPLDRTHFKNNQMLLNLCCLSSEKSDLLLINLTVISQI